MKQQFPEPIVGTFIQNNKGEIILIKTHKWNGKYCVPGGHIEVGETMEQASKRETKEETGLDVYEPKFLVLHEYLPDGSFHTKRHFIFLNYLLKTDSTEVTLNDEAEDFVWVKPRKH